MRFNPRPRAGANLAAECNGLGDLFRALPAGAGQCGYVKRYLWFDQLYYLPDDILCKCDRMSMAHSLEVRPPFLDHRIVEFAAALPEDLKIRGPRLKYVLRGALKPLLLDTLTGEAVRRAAVFRPEAIQEAVRGHLERRANLGFHLWGLLTLFRWMDRWKTGPPAHQAEWWAAREPARAFATS